MKIDVVIHRQTEKEPKRGTLRAYVLQNGRRGENLLGRGEFTAIDSAVQAADAAVLAKFKSMDAPEINYIIEEDPAK